MKDIAQGLGLSVVTISKVLRLHPDISEETRQRVLTRNGLTDCISSFRPNPRETSLTPFA